MSTPKISVIMGIYNCASTLEEALDSLYTQTYQDFEIILCEDGSSDNTYEVAEKYATMHSNIVLLRNEKNMGLSFALNKCLEVAKGEYIARMDGDDISLPTRFEKENKFLDEHLEFEFVSTPMAHFDENGVWRKGTAIEYPQSSDFKYHAPFCHAPCMVRKRAYDKVNGYCTSPSVHRMEDYYLWYTMYKANMRGYNIQEILYMMRDDNEAVNRRAINISWQRILKHREILKGLNIKCADFIILVCQLKQILIILFPPCLIQVLRRFK